jgi:hypothetical protein
VVVGLLLLAEEELCLLKKGMAITATIVVEQ